MEIKGVIDDTPPKPIGGKDTKDKVNPYASSESQIFLETVEWTEFQKYYVNKYIIDI